MATARSIQDAIKVRAEGTPELVNAVNAGQASVSAAAQIASLGRDEQVKIVKTPGGLGLKFCQIDLQHVAGEGRIAHVRRVARADAGQRQDLPQALPGADQPIDEVVGLGPEITRAMWAGQGSGVQQHATGAGESHGGS